MILRVFRAEVREGRQDDFRRFVTETALPLTLAQDGLVSVELGEPRPESPREFAMVTVWRDLDALKRFAGDAWHEAVVLPEEADLLAASHVHHYDLLRP